jgi:hypothetical protein
VVDRQILGLEPDFKGVGYRAACAYIITSADEYDVNIGLVLNIWLEFE